MEAIQDTCKWVPSNHKAHSPEAFVAYVMEVVDKVSKTHKGPPRRHLLMKRETHQGLKSLKLYPGKGLVDFVRKLTKHPVNDVMDVLTSK